VCDDLKAIDIQVLDIRDLTQIADYFVICSGIGDRQIKAIAQSLKDSLKDCGAARLGSEGEAAGGWVLLDYVDVIVHVFNEDARGFYQLELLWGDAGPVVWQA
jgi:ribosome-associated protein